MYCKKKRGREGERRGGEEGGGEWGGGGGSKVERVGVKGGRAISD